MNPRNRLFLFWLPVLLLTFLRLPPLAAAEYSNGMIRLVLDEETGRFAIYSLNDGGRGSPPAFFADRDPRTSFLSVMVNDRAYKMGDSSAFRVRLGSGPNPSLIFESSFMAVIEEFSLEANRVTVTITLENRGDRQISAGARFLLDTNLGEGSSDVSFKTNRGAVTSETLITKARGDSFWIDENSRLSLTGSLYPGSFDSVHFANWKKLSDVTWKAPYREGSRFNAPPYSVGDTAVCYYYEPRPLSRGEKRGFGFALVLNDKNGFTNVHAAPGGTSGEETADLPEVPSDRELAELAARKKDIADIKELMAKIDAGIALGTATEEELAAFELALNKFRAKYAPTANSR